MRRIERPSARYSLLNRKNTFYLATSTYRTTRDDFERCREGGIERTTEKDKYTLRGEGGILMNTKMSHSSSGQLPPRRLFFLPTIFIASCRAIFINSLVHLILISDVFAILSDTSPGGVVV